VGALTSPNATCSFVTVVVFNPEATENVTWSVGTRPRAFKVFERRPTARPRDLQRVIENLRSTLEGDAAWSRTQEAKHEARREAMALGRMNRVKYFRIERGMTQQQLAVAIGSKQSDISRYERLGYKAKVQTLEKLARTLGVNVADLL
jgi:ribosome-binding protein aMBF1 (putative translation factor)